MTKKRLTPEKAIANIRGVRRENLRALCNAFGGNAALAIALEVPDSYLTQLIGPNPSKPITENTARKFEYRLKLDTGALDQE